MKKHEFCIPETNTIAKPIAEIIGSTDGGAGKYVYEDTGIKCPSNIPTTLKSDVGADKWLNVASKPILDPFTKPMSSFLQPNSLLTTSYKRDIDFQPNISIPNNLPNLNTISSSNNNVSQDSIKVTARYQNIMKGFTGQVLGGAVHDERHKRDYSEKPQVNKEMLAAARKIDREGTSKSVNFMLFHKHHLNDDDMYWLSSIFNTHTPKGLAVNMVDLSDNDIKLTRDHNLTYQDLPFFSFNSPYNTPRNILRLDLSNNQIGDAGAKVIADGLANGVFPITKCINLTGNKITDKGESFFVKILKDPTVQRIAILLEDLGQNLKIQSGKKEHVVPELHNILKKAQDRGVDVKNMVVDLSFLTWVKT